MTETESAERFAVRVHAARVSMKADRLLNRPSPDWIVALVEEGRRRGVLGIDDEPEAAVR
jgi:hypothetical protein